jgi:hypothetical protein
MTAEMVAYARSLVEDVEFSAEDALRSDWDFLAQARPPPRTDPPPLGHFGRPGSQPARRHRRPGGERRCCGGRSARVLRAGRCGGRPTGRCGGRPPHHRPLAWRVRRRNGACRGLAGLPRGVRVGSVAPAGEGRWRHLARGGWGRAARPPPLSPSGSARLSEGGGPPRAAVGAEARVYSPPRLLGPLAGRPRSRTLARRPAGPAAAHLSLSSPPSLPPSLSFSLSPSLPPSHSPPLSPPSLSLWRRGGR